MTTELATIEFSKSQAERACALFLKNDAIRRALLLAMFERKAHTALGFTNFVEFCDMRLKMQEDENTIKDTLRWARTERNLFGTTFLVDELVDEKLPMGNLHAQEDYIPPKLTKREFRLLAKLEKPAIQKAAFYEIEGIRALGNRTSADLEFQLSKIVKRLTDPSPIDLTSMTPLVTAPTKPQPSTQNAPAPSTAAKATVSIFTPEPEPIDPFSDEFEDAPKAQEEPPHSIFQQSLFDKEEFLFALENAFAWVTNGEVEGKLKTREVTADTLRDIAKWIEDAI